MHGSKSTLVSDKMHTLMLYNELMKAVLEPTHKIIINQYLEQNSTILSTHLLEDL